MQLVLLWKTWTSLWRNSRRHIRQPGGTSCLLPALNPKTGRAEKLSPCYARSQAPDHQPHPTHGTVTPQLLALTCFRGGHAPGSENNTTLCSSVSWELFLGQKHPWPSGSQTEREAILFLTVPATGLHQTGGFRTRCRQRLKHRL